MGSVKTTYRVLKPLKTGGRSYGRGELIPAAEKWGMAIVEQRLRTQVIEKAFVSEDEYNLATGVVTPDEQPAEVAPVVETQQTEEPVVAENAAGSPPVTEEIVPDLDDEFEDAEDDEADDEISVQEIEEEDSDEETETDSDAPAVTGARRKIKRKRDV